MMLAQFDDLNLFDEATTGVVPVETVHRFLKQNHYLGPAKRGFAWVDELGVLVLASPTSRHIPPSWLELTRWCLTGIANGGSTQWSRVVRWLKTNRPDVTTVVSYSDPSVGHTGALYRASNWLAAPTWHSYFDHPSGNGDWGIGIPQAVKDRWVYPITPDRNRESALAIPYERLAHLAAYEEPKRFARYYR